jgi:hypothetical protein
LGGVGWIGLAQGTGGELLWTWWWTFGFHKMLGNNWVAAQPIASRVVLSYTQLLRYINS